MKIEISEFDLGRLDMFVRQGLSNEQEGYFRAACPILWDAIREANLQDLDAGLIRGIKKILADGKTVLAVKFVRDKTGWPLRESKEYVEGLLGHKLFEKSEGG